MFREPMPERFKSGVSRALRRALWSSGMGMSELSRDSGVPITTVSSVMSGARVPSLWTLRRLCEALGASADEVIGLKEEK